MLWSKNITSTDMYKTHKQSENFTRICCGQQKNTLLWLEGVTAQEHGSFLPLKSQAVFSLYFKQIKSTAINDYSFSFNQPIFL